MKIKPRLQRFGDVWVCRNYRACGSGRTPLAAYEAWRFERSYMARLDEVSCKDSSLFWHNAACANVGNPDTCSPNGLTWWHQRD